ncbi:T9SS type B sorting domain-containing protein [Winogradskyella sp.]|uniref:lectin-like domain-containing protein n=1 Tax=Winogradskyella sp. TaxID=1883156 RepID=UPI0025E42A38|nr:T9SS type B sorting domain-containing protein [Winogradskyella sp.]
MFAQLNSTTVGSASDIGNNCFIITPALNNQAGGVWYDNAIDFDNDFTIYFQANFGDQDANGADGMALVFKDNPNAQIGNTGGGMGYQGIGAPLDPISNASLIIEFDTYRNNSPSEGLLADPFYDHIAIQRNGDPFHNNAVANLAGPIQASSTSVDIEDGDTHEVKIQWIASLNMLNVFFDCDFRLSLDNFDIKNVIFSGDDSVFFGFVGSTGGLNNLHQVCFNSITFVDNLNLQDATICENEFVSIDASIPSGVNYMWAPTDGVSNPNIPNPVLMPSVTTTYTVEIRDICGETSFEDVTVNVTPNITPTFDAVSPICSGEALAPLPTTSNNGITGTWAPAIDNTQTTTYTFTPNPGECAFTETLTVTVNPNIIPTFDAVFPICSGDALAPLPTTSNDGFTGTWSPALDNTQTTTYTFTPDAGQGCVINQTLEIIVNPIIAPTFDAVSPICSGEALAPLPTTSNNGITGTWTPALDNTQTTTYTFTPNPGECAFTETLTITVNPNIAPTFDSVSPICSGEALAPLPTTSNNGITGTWTPALDNTQTTTYTFTPGPDECAFTETLTIIVIPNIIPTFDAVTPICFGEALAPLPTTSNNGITGVWSPALDNTQTTTYTFTPDIGQGCVINQTLEIVVITPMLPTFNSFGPICSGDVLEPLPTISNEGITGNWSPAIDNTQTTNYTFTPDPGQCSAPITETITVLEISELSIAVDLVSQPFSGSQTVIANVIGGTGDYIYQLDNGPWVSTNSFSNISGCDIHTIRASEASGCSNIVSETFQVLDYPKFFTPNGDVYNNFWNISCLANQPSSIISIFDRYGKLLKQISPASSGWDGTYNGNLMPSNDYWFQVNYIDNDGLPRVFSSHFSLKR